MEDRQVEEITKSLKTLGSVVSNTGFIIFVGLMYVGCQIMMHH